MRYVIMFITFAALLTGCCCRTQSLRPEYYGDGNPYAEEMTKVVVSYAVELENTRHLMLEKSHVCMDDSINKLELHFLTQNIVELCEAREELVAVVEGFLKKINDNVKLRPRLERFPFTYRNLEVHITYGSYFVLYVDPTYISSSALEEGTSFFYDGQLEAPHSDIWSRRVEPYYKTLQLVTYRKRAEEPYLEAEKQKMSETYLREERFIN